MPKLDHQSAADYAASCREVLACGTPLMLAHIARERPEAAAELAEAVEALGPAVEALGRAVWRMAIVDGAGAARVH